jgi:hypothetical protein
MELLVLAALAFAAVVVFGVLATVFSIVMGLIALPFRIIGWLLHGALALLAIPFLIVLAIVGVIVFGAGMLFILVPALPIVAMVFLAIWLVRRNQRQAAASPTHSH